MNDRLFALRLFMRVARVGSFSAAGRELGLSQPSASRILAELEREIGVALLTRTSGGAFFPSNSALNASSLSCSDIMISCSLVWAWAPAETVHLLAQR